MARNKQLQPVTVKEIVSEEHFSVTFTEKILQQLRKANIIESHQGHGGGYVLARNPSEITFKEVIECLEGQTFDVFCAPKVREDIVCNHFSLCGLKPVWSKTKQLLDEFYSEVTLDMIVNKETNMNVVNDFHVLKEANG